MITFVVFIILHLLSLYFLEVYVDSYYNKRISDNKTTPQVFDIAHKYLPDLHYVEWIHHLTFIFLIPMFFYPVIYKEYSSYWLILFIIRSFMIVVTVLPKYKNCSTKNEDNNKIYKLLTGGCYDKIFSGHFASILLATLLYLKYGLININNLIFINIINAFLILATRSHYTIDILVAIFVTLFVYQSPIFSLN